MIEMDDPKRRWDDPGPLCDTRILDAIVKIIESETGRPIEKTEEGNLVWPAFFADLLATLRGKESRIEEKR